MASMNRPQASTTPGLARLVWLTATLLVGLSAGFFFTYEASVTLGLARVSDTAYVETFQQINETVRNPAFGIVFFGSLPAIALALVAAWRTAPSAARVFLLVALALYVTGVAITGAGNVPLNNDLADVDDLSPARASAARAEFEDDWNRLNLLRALAIGASFASLTAAGLFLSARDGDSGGIAGQTGRP